MKQGTPRLTPQGVVWEIATATTEKPEPAKPPAIRREFAYRIEDGKGDCIAHIRVRPRDGVYWLDDLWVHPDQRRKGYASALIKAALDDWHFEHLYLAIEPYTDQPLDSAALVAFYVRFGFKETSVPGVLFRRGDG